MKKILVTLFVLGTMFVGQNVDAIVNPTIKIIKPGYLQTWEKGKTYDISWSVSGDYDPDLYLIVNLNLLRSENDIAGSRQSSLIFFRNKSNCVDSNASTVDCIKVSELTAKVSIPKSIPAGKYNVEFSCRNNNDFCLYDYGDDVIQKVNIIDSPGQPQLSISQIPTTKSVLPGENKALMASYILDGTQSPSDLYISQFRTIQGYKNSFSSSTQSIIYDDNSLLSNCALYNEKRLLSVPGNLSSGPNKFNIYDQRTGQNQFTIKAGSKEQIDLRCDISSSVPYINGYYLFNFKPKYNELYFGSQNSSYIMGAVDSTATTYVKLEPVQPTKISKDGTLSVSVSPILDQATLLSLTFLISQSVLI
jgi:hypothetical protein